MSFSIPGGGSGAEPSLSAGTGAGASAPAMHGQADPTKAASHPDFGARLGQYMESRFPIASGLAQSVFGGGNSGGGGGANTSVPVPQLPGPIMSSGPAVDHQPDYSGMISANAKPKEGGGGLSMLLKLLGV